MDSKSSAPRLPRLSPTRRRRSLLGEVYRGAVLGDFAMDKGLIGVLTQIIVGYLPIAGTLGALRDAAADWRARDAFGVIVNILAAFPVLGGFPKTLEVLHSVHQAHRVHRALAGPDAPQARTRRAGGVWRALARSAVVLGLAVAYGLGVQLAAEHVWASGAPGGLMGPGNATVALLILAALLTGFLFGEALSIRSRAWLGALLLPAALLAGLFLLAGGLNLPVA
jgi:hypothetical protein